jgi:hypothetical protein
MSDSSANIAQPYKLDASQHPHFVSLLPRSIPATGDITYRNPTHSETFYLLSVGLGHIAGARLGQAIQLAFSMGLYSDAKTEALGLDTIEVQLRRRTFWQLYATDK